MSFDFAQTKLTTVEEKKHNISIDYLTKRFVKLYLMSGPSKLSQLVHPWRQPRGQLPQNRTNYLYLNLNADPIAPGRTLGLPTPYRGQLSVTILTVQMLHIFLKEAKLPFVEILNLLGFFSLLAEFYV